MKPENLSEIQKAFSAQAAEFDSEGYHLAKQDYLDYIVEKTAPAKSDTILEVAAGTCICGRALAPFAHHVICLDATPAMLAVGKKECEKAGITNLTQVKGYAETLPFPDDSFDVIISRLAFHHFTKPNEIFREMARVLKPGGKLILIDLIPGDITLRDEIDRIERLRDPSHTRNLSLPEMANLYSQSNIKLELQEQTDIPVVLEDWMELTKTPEEARGEIRHLMQTDIDGVTPTGFSPYMDDDKIYFNHHWVFNLGRK